MEALRQQRRAQPVASGATGEEVAGQEGRRQEGAGQEDAAKKAPAKKSAAEEERHEEDVATRRSLREVIRTRVPGNSAGS